MSRLSVVHNPSSFHMMRLSNWDLFDWVPPPSLLELAVWRREGCITVTDGALLPCKHCSTLWSKIRLSHVKCMAANSGRFNYNQPLPRFIFWKEMGRRKLLKVWKDGELPLWKLEYFLSLCLFCLSLLICVQPQAICLLSGESLTTKPSKGANADPQQGSFGDFEMKMGCSAVMPTLRWITFHIGFGTEGWERLSQSDPGGALLLCWYWTASMSMLPTSYFLAEVCEAFPVCTSMSSRCWRRGGTPGWSRPGMPG